MNTEIKRYILIYEEIKLLPQVYNWYLNQVTLGQPAVTKASFGLLQQSNTTSFNTIVYSKKCWK